MFDNLKTKLKGLFKKAPAEVAEPDAPAVPRIEEPAAQPAVQEAPKQEPVKQEPAPALSRKEQLKAEKEAKKAAKKEEKAAKKEQSSAPLVSDEGGFFDKKIKEDSLEDLLWELELALMEADVALPVVEEIKEGVKQNLLGKK